MSDPGAHPGDFLALDDRELLAQCSRRVHRASGPGGQHRNKVSTAVTLHHRPTGVTAQAYDSRSQAQNRRSALKRLRMKIACHCRRPLDLAELPVPEAVRCCIFEPRKAVSDAPRRLQVGRKDHRYWAVAAFLLDLLEACGGRLSPAASRLHIGTSNLTAVLKQDRHAFAAAGEIRRRHGLGPLK